MKIIMCVKSVKSDLVYQDNSRYDESVINPYDLFALKEVLSLKNNIECDITCISMGAMTNEEILIKCLAMGVDNGILLSDAAFSGADTIATTYVLSEAIKKIESYKLIVCGDQSIDGETGQVVYGLAERLHIPCISKVNKIVEIKENSIVLEAFYDNYINTIEVKMPALISFCDFTTVRENIGLLSIKKAKRKGITIWKSEDIGVDKNRSGSNGSKTKVLKINDDFIKKGDVIFVEGTYEDKANVIHNIITRKNIGEML